MAELVRSGAEFRLRLATVPCGGRTGWKDGLRLLHLEVGDLGFDLRLELVRGAAEFGEKTPGLTSHLRQLLRPKENERQEEEEDRVGKTHGLIIMRDCKGGNAPAFLWNCEFVLEAAGNSGNSYGDGLRTTVLRSSPAMMR